MEPRPPSPRPPSPRQLGRTGIAVSAIGLGCWQFSEGVGPAGLYWPALGQDRVNEIVAAALRAGVTWFDTAEFYGRGRSERALATALQAAGVAPGQVAVATKWWPMFRGAGSIRGTVGSRVEALRPYAIDLHQVHNPFALASTAAQMEAMADLVSAGIVRAVGVSNFSAAGMAAAHQALARRGLGLASNQMRYSLLDRAIEKNGVLAQAKAQGTTIIAYSPLAQGVLTGRFHRDPASIAKISRTRRMKPAFRKLEAARPLVQALAEIGAAHGAGAAQVALAWLLQFHGPTVVAIPGASSVAQAEGNAAAMRLTLTRAELDRIDQLSQPLN